MGQDPAPELEVAPGQTVYDEEGLALGTIRGITEDGFLVTTREGVESLSVEHEHAGHGAGEAELMWRCLSCGEVGDIEDLPEECPACGGDKEGIYYYIDD